MNKSHDHFRDLPKRIAAHAGETTSRKKLSEIIGETLFLERRTTENDYGVDLEYEIIADGRMTNYRIHVQLKSSTKDSNKDLSYSYSVARSNLNYLLHNHGSVYVFYSREDDRLLYKKAIDVYQEYEQSGKDWHSQKTVTVKFTDDLDKSSLQVLHSETLDSMEAIFIFKLALEKAGTIAYGKIIVNPDDLSIENVSEAARLIEENGLAAVAIGRPDYVLCLANSLPGGRTENVNVNGVIAYAKYVIGEYFPSIAMSRECLRHEDLSEDLIVMLKFAQAASKLSVGLISLSDYIQIQESIVHEHSNNHISMYSQLHLLRFEGAKGFAEKAIEGCETIAKRAVELGKGYGILALLAKCIKLEIMNQSNMKKYSEAVFGLKFQESMGMDHVTIRERVKITREIISTMKDVHAGFADLASEVVKDECEVIAGDVLMCWAEAGLLNLYYGDQFSNSEDSSASRDRYASALHRRICVAVDYHNKYGQIESALRAKLTCARMHKLTKNDELARTEVEETMKAAERLGFELVLQEAKELEKGVSPWDQMLDLPNADEWFKDRS